MPTNDPPSATATFGPNLWLVEEMYQLFLDDPSAVHASWHEFFADYQPVAVGGTGEVADRLTSPRFGGPPVPEAPAEKVATADPTVADATRAPVATPTRPASGSASKAARPNAVAEQGRSTPLRGAASAVVKNMEASLEVPTATSVRAVPAKLLADNRLVINNQLRRTRGGKISFTCGRPSSATSSTAPSRSSTSSSPPARPSGASTPTWRCCSRTASKARDPTTPPAASNGSSSSAPRAR